MSINNNNFDFGKIGKNLPYQSESEFLGVATDLTLNKINSMKKRRRIWKFASSVAASIIIVLGFTLFNNSSNNVDINNISIDDLISNMSDSRLEEFVYMVDSDAFLVDDFNL